MSFSRKILSLIFILTFLSGCQPILRLAFGVKKPQVENPESLSRFAKEVGIPKNNMYTLNASEQEYVISRLGGIRHFFFDRAQYRMKEPVACTPKSINDVDDIVEHHKSKGVFTETFDYTFDSIAKRLRTTDGTKVIPETDSSSYKAVVVWGKFMGKKRVKKLVKFSEEIRKSDYPFEVYYVNIDHQEYWEQEEDNKTPIRLQVDSKKKTE